MSADRKKRLSSASVFGYSSREQYRAKKKHLSSSSQFDLNRHLNSHTSLKWDNNEKRAVVKGEQIGLSKRDLRPSKAPVLHHDNSLADVIAIPKDMFELDDLADVLSFEVWQSNLTETERSHLTQFLPRGVNPDQVVQGLLAGENLHFGNPFLKWSSALYSGELHPEAVVHNDQTFIADRKSYYSELQKYHDNMIRNLQKLKDRCANSKDPEAEIEQIMRRTRKQPGKEVRYHNRGQSVAVDEKASSSDNQSPLKTKLSELPRSNKDTSKDKDEKQVGSSDAMKVASKSKKREKFKKANVNLGDGSKYMSYVKISKSQHDLIRSMKQSGNSIQSKALIGVIGNLSSFNVKPYVMFEEEERKRIGEYWSNLVKKDLPSAFSKWGKIQVERGQFMKTLCLEIEEKLSYRREEEEMDYSDGSNYDEEGSVSSDDTEQIQQGEVPTHESASDDVQDSDPSTAEEQPSLRIPSLDVNQFAEVDASLQASSLDVNQKCSSVDLNEEDNHISPKSNDTCSMKSECHVTAEASEEACSASESPQKKTSVDVVASEVVTHSSAADAWPAITMVGSSFCPSAMDFTSCSEMPLKHSKAVEEQTAHLIDLESGIPAENPSKSMLPQQTDHLPFFGSYQNEERHDLLHTIVKHDNYHDEPKKTAIEFHPTTSLLTERNQFPVHSREQLHPSFPLEAMHRASSDFFLHPNIQENMYPDNFGYSNPRPQQFTSISMREWSSAPRFSAPVNAPLSNSMDLLNHNWFPVENRAQSGWSGSEVFSNPSLGSGSGSGDQSLYSVLTQCNNLHPAVPAFTPVGPTDEYMPTGNFAENLGIGVPRSNPLPPSVAASPLEYLSGHDIAPSTLKTDDMGWMNLPHQSSTLHDSTGKPFPKSWNQ